MPAHRSLRRWGMLTTLVGALIGWPSAVEWSTAAGPGSGPARAATLAGLGLAALGLAVLAGARKLDRFVDGPVDEAPPRWERSPYLTLFVASYLALFLEVMFIRYVGSQFRVFSFYKNVPLVSAYLGLGLGCSLAGGKPRHAFAIAAWSLPLAVASAFGATLVSKRLGAWAAVASSEHILGDVVVNEPSARDVVVDQLLLGGFCVIALVALASFFAIVGRLLGASFDRVARLRGYTVNILGSLFGIGVFLVLGWLETPPWVWFVCGLGPLVYWMADARRAAAVLALSAAAAAAVAPSWDETVWSAYQRLVGREIPPGPGGTGTASSAYEVEISDVFYQVAIDLRPENVARMGENPFPHYDRAFVGLAPLDDVLVVGAGTGNDVAAALRAGAKHVDAVDIDRAIVAMGRAHHPERPYDDPRVRVIVDDARAAFRKGAPGTYDAVVFGLLDSHTQLGVSSVRLDNYVFTLESLEAARRLLKPGGAIVLTAATFRPWFFDRFTQMLEATCESPVDVAKARAWVTYRCRVADPTRPPTPLPAAKRATLPTDDWPFLYLPERGVPTAYLVGVAILAAASIVVLRANGLRLGRFGAHHGHLFFLGAAFLLMEVSAVNRLALLFGTTWIVSAVTIALVLSFIVAANATVPLARRVPTRAIYAALVASLAVSFWLDPAIALGRGLAFSIGLGLLLLLPVFFAGLVFARSFSAAKEAGPALGANMLGSVLGGWVEYGSMAVGTRALVLLAATFYVVSGLLLWKAERAAGAPASPAAPA